MDKTHKPGHFGLDAHINDVSHGNLTAEYLGQQQSLRRHWALNSVSDARLDNADRTIIKAPVSIPFERVTGRANPAD